MSVTAIEAIEKRRSIRQYDPDYQIPQEISDKMLNHLQQPVIFKEMILS